MTAPTDTYRVSRHPKRGMRWWAPGEVIPPNHTDVREATEREAALIRLIRGVDKASSKLDEVRREREERTVVQWPGAQGKKRGTTAG